MADVRKAPAPEGWPERFLALFARSGNVSDAARRAKATRGAVYERLKADAEFALAFEDAREAASDLLELEATRRAVRGVRKAVWYKGVKVGEELTYSDGLLIELLRANRPEKFRQRSETVHKGGVTHTHEFPDLNKLLELPADELLRLHRETLGLPGEDR